MLLFLVGIGVVELIIVLVIFALVGVGIFYLIRPLVRRLLKNQSQGAINTVTRLIAIILTPVLFVLVIYLVFLYYSDSEPYRRSEEDIAQHYKMMEEDLNKNLKIGMSKSEALAEFAIEDTTQSEYELDLSVPDAKEEYFLKLKFDKGKLSSFDRLEP
jgi:predicted PurR-regulated permease PerM